MTNESQQKAKEKLKYTVSEVKIKIYPTKTYGMQQKQF